MEDTLLELLEVCRQKEFYSMHNDVDDLIKKSLQNFRVKKSSTSLNYTSHISSVHAITPVLPTEEPEYSLSMGYEHPSTILETESDEVINSSAKNLLPIPSEYEVTSDDESECDVPVKDESSLVFTTFSNPIFDDNDDFTSSDDESLSDEDVPMEDFKVYSNPLFDDEEISSDEIDPHYFNTESDFVESLSNRDTLIDSSLKFDYLEEFSGALMPTSIIDEERIRREHAEYINLMEKLFTINLFLRSMENFHVNTIVETLPTSPIPVEDGDSQREEIDIFTGTDDLLPPGIKSENYDSEGDINFLKELLVDDSIPIIENKSSNFDHQDDPSFPRPPPEPPNVEFFFDLEPDLIAAVMKNIDELNEYECFDPGGEINVFENVKDDDYFSFIFVIRIFLPYLIYPEVSHLLLSARNEDTILTLASPFRAGGISLGWNFHAKKESSDEECSTFGSDDEEYVMAICLGVDLEPDEYIKDSGCSKHMTGNRKLFSTHKEYNGGNVIFGSNLTGNIIGKGTPQSNGVVKRKNRTLQEMSRTMLIEQSLPQKFWCNAVDTSTYILNRILIRAILGKTLRTLKRLLVVINKHTKKVKESLNMTFDETLLPSKTSPLVDDNLDEEEAIKVTEKKNLENDIVDETLEIDEIVNIKESRNHPLENVIENLNQRILRSQAQNKNNFFCFISTIEPKIVNEALGDESWIVTMQEELNQFVANDVWKLVPQPKNMTIIKTKWLFRNKLDENGIVSRNKARLVAQGHN
nr:retrovirus-related Pol polyprotein from transposon TNT 1-94 [Tanacetum cinerariifolium]